MNKPFPYLVQRQWQFGWATIEVSPSIESARRAAVKEKERTPKKTVRIVQLLEEF